MVVLSSTDLKDSFLQLTLPLLSVQSFLNILVMVSTFNAFLLVYNLTTTNDRKMNTFSPVLLQKTEHKFSENTKTEYGIHIKVQLLL